MPFLAFAVWKVVSNFISEFTLQNIDVQRVSLDLLHQQAPLTSLELKLGGTAPNVSEHFFPPASLEASPISINII